MESERLYRFAVIKHPTKEEREKGVRSEVVLPPSDYLLAKNEAEVMMIATRQIPEAWMKNADRLEVAVSPF